MIGPSSSLSARTKHTGACSSTGCQHFAAAGQPGTPGHSGECSVYVIYGPLSRVPPACPQHTLHSRSIRKKEERLARSALAPDTAARTHLFNLQRHYFNPWKETTAHYAYVRNESTKNLCMRGPESFVFAAAPRKWFFFFLLNLRDACASARRVRACVIIWHVCVMLCWFKLCLPEQQAAGWQSQLDQV